MVLVVCLSFLLLTIDTGVNGYSSDDKDIIMNVMMVSTPLSGHITPMINLGEELSNRGHNVTFFTPKLSWVDKSKRILENGMDLVYAGNMSIGKMEFLHLHELAIASHDLSAFQEALHHQIDPIAKYIPKLNLSQWDIIVVDDFSSSVVACMAKKQGVSVMSLSPRFDPIATWLNHPPWTIPLSLVPGYREQMNFVERFTTTMVTLFISIMGDSIQWKLFYPPSIREECKSIQYAPVTEGIEYPLMLSSVIGFEYARTISPLMHYVGPVYSKKQQSLPEDIEKWLNSQHPRQCILISMGSISEVTEEFAAEFIHAIESTNYSAIWTLRLSTGSLKYDKSRFFITSWIPQFTVLQHHSVAMAVIHGGAGGLNDAMYNAVPVICVPFGGDQTENCFRVQEYRAGITLNEQERIADKIKESIEKIENESYRENALRMRNLLVSGGGVDRAADLVELYGTVGYDHLLPAYVKYNWSWVQYRNLDVYLTLGLGLAFPMIAYCLVKRWYKNIG